MKTRHFPSAQRGTVLIISLIILVVMLISAAALVRSFDISLTTAGNLAFKRDLAQQSEQATQTILTHFRPAGLLAGTTAREASNASLNYSAVVLPSNPQGIPTALLTSDLPSSTGTAPDIDAGNGVTLRYVVDRLCSATGEPSLTACMLADSTIPRGGDARRLQRGGAEHSSGAVTEGGPPGGTSTPSVIYRISVRATGPRGTQSFFQTTFSCCDN